MRISRKTLKIIGASAAVFFIAALLFLMDFMKAIKEYQSQVSAISFVNVGISDVRDGTYTGECDVNIIYAKVEVIVQRGEIINISLLEHRNGRGLSAEEIVDRIVAEQTVNVDAVTSATNSSIVIKKAVENALTSGVQ